MRLLAGLAPPDQTLLLTDGLDGPALDPLIKALPTRGWRSSGRRMPRSLSA
ncbi:hypothetical protein [Hankyongella ginsenosidimutans]|uniref:hypothetical protein n=1 Tax=Hankyongella ginsenosidimutans TaxID=1763828 RepID=UPI001CA33805|nr:hypothetical protein [Hankyongella ginsenosidimutans]